MYLTTKLDADEIAMRVREADAYERFSVLTFRNTFGDDVPDDVIVTDADGNVYLGTVTDADDVSIYVDLT